MSNQTLLCKILPLLPILSGEVSQFSADDLWPCGIWPLPTSPDLLLIINLLLWFSATEPYKPTQFHKHTLFTLCFHTDEFLLPRIFFSLFWTNFDFSFITSLKVRFFQQVSWGLQESSLLFALSSSLPLIGTLPWRLNSWTDMSHSSLSYGFWLWGRTRQPVDAIELTDTVIPSPLTRSPFQGLMSVFRPQHKLWFLSVNNHFPLWDVRSTGTGASCVWVCMFSALSIMFMYEWIDFPSPCRSVELDLPNLKYPSPEDITGRQTIQISS